MINQSDRHYKSTIMAYTVNVLCFFIVGFVLTPSFGGSAQLHLIENQKPNKTTSLNATQLAQFLSSPKQKIISTNTKLEFKLSGNIRNDNKQVIKQFNEKRFFSTPPPKSSSIPRIAILLPLTGPHAKLGQAMLNAAQLALFHFADRQIELLPQDTKGTESGAFDAATQAISDGASLILGPLFSRSVVASAPVARAAGIKIIAFSNDSSIAGDGVFTMGFLPQEQVRRVVTFAISQGFKRFAVLAPDSSYGLTIVNALRQVTEENNTEVSAQVFYDPQTTNFHPVIRSLANYDERRQKLIDTRDLLAERDDEVAKLALKRLENLQTMGDVAFDALLIADGGKVLQSIAALLPYYDIDPKKIRMLGTGHWDVSRIGSEPALVGGWFAAPSPESRREFIKQYESVYDEKPPRLATLAYDATALAAVFAQSEESDELMAKQPLFQLLELSASRGFKGLDGIFRFLPEGYVERGLSIFQVGERNNKIISRSPQKFMNPSD